MGAGVSVLSPMSHSNSPNEVFNDSKEINGRLHVFKTSKSSKYTFKNFFSFKYTKDRIKFQKNKSHEYEPNCSIEEIQEQRNEKFLRENTIEIENKKGNDNGQKGLSSHEETKFDDNYRKKNNMVPTNMYKINSDRKDNSEYKYDEEKDNCDISFQEELVASGLGLEDEVEKGYKEVDDQIFGFLEHMESIANLNSTVDRKGRALRKENLNTNSDIYNNIEVHAELNQNLVNDESRETCIVSATLLNSQNNKNKNETVLSGTSDSSTEDSSKLLKLKRLSSRVMTRQEVISVFDMYSCSESRTEKLQDEDELISKSIDRPLSGNFRISTIGDEKLYTSKQISSQINMQDQKEFITEFNPSSSTSSIDYHNILPPNESSDDISMEGVKARARKVLQAKKEKERQLAEAGLLKRKKKKIKSRWEQKQEQEKQATQNILQAKARAYLEINDVDEDGDEEEFEEGSFESFNYENISSDRLDSFSRYKDQYTSSNPNFEMENGIDSVHDKKRKIVNFVEETSLIAMNSTSPAPCTPRRSRKTNESSTGENCNISLKRNHEEIQNMKETKVDIIEDPKTEDVIDDTKGKRDQKSTDQETYKITTTEENEEKDNELMKIVEILPGKEKPVNTIKNQKPKDKFQNLKVIIDNHEESGKQNNTAEKELEIKKEINPIIISNGGLANDNVSKMVEKQKPKFMKFAPPKLQLTEESTRNEVLPPKSCEKIKVEQSLSIKPLDYENFHRNITEQNKANSNKPCHLNLRIEINNHEEKNVDKKIAISSTPFKKDDKPNLYSSAPSQSNTDNSGSSSLQHRPNFKKIASMKDDEDWIQIQDDDDDDDEMGDLSPRSSRKGKLIGSSPRYQQYLLGKKRNPTDLSSLIESDDNGSNGRKSVRFATNKEELEPHTFNVEQSHEKFAENKYQMLDSANLQPNKSYYFSNESGAFHVKGFDLKIGNDGIIDSDTDTSQEESQSPTSVASASTAMSIDDDSLSSFGKDVNETALTSKDDNNSFESYRNTEEQLVNKDNQHMETFSRKKIDNSMLNKPCQMSNPVKVNIALETHIPHLPMRERLVILNRLGQGASGTVYRAFDLCTLKYVALKVIQVFDRVKRKQLAQELSILYHHFNYRNVLTSSKTQQTAIENGFEEEKFEKCDTGKENEEQIQTRDRFRHVTAFYDAFANVENKTVSLMMEYMDGGSLQDLVDIGGTQCEETLATIAYQCLLGLAYIHSRHQIHRDIKPANVLVNRRGEIKISDFGISRQISRGPTTSIKVEAAEFPKINEPTDISKEGRYQENDAIPSGPPVTDINQSRMNLDHKDFFLEDNIGETKDDHNHVKGVSMLKEKTKTFVGTVTYMSPERINGDEYSYSSDIWSLGLILVSIARGSLAVKTKGGYWGILQCVRDEPSPSLPEKRSIKNIGSKVNRLDSKEGNNEERKNNETEWKGNEDWSEEIKAFIARCLEKNPAERSSAEELIKDPFLLKYSKMAQRVSNDKKADICNPNNKNFSQFNSPSISQENNDDSFLNGIDYLRVYPDSIEDIQERQDIYNAIWEHLQTLGDKANTVILKRRRSHNSKKSQGWKTSDIFHMLLFQRGQYALQEFADQLHLSIDRLSNELKTFASQKEREEEMNLSTTNLKGEENNTPVPKNDQKSSFIARENAKNLLPNINISSKSNDTVQQTKQNGSGLGFGAKLGISISLKNEMSSAF